MPAPLNNCLDGSANARVRNASSYCNIYDFLLGVLTYNSTVIDPMVELIMTLDFPDSNHTNRLAYEISLDPFVDKYDSAAERGGIYDFCTLSFGACSVAMFNIFGGQHEHSVSEFHYQIPQPACTDTFSIDNW